MTQNNLILFWYLCRTYGVVVLGLFAVLIAVMGIFDAIESLRILSKTRTGDLGSVLYLTGLKTPGNILKISTFVMLFSAMIHLYHLQKRQELVVMRVSGASLWQILAPFFVVSFLYGVVLVAIIHPISTRTERHYDQYEQQMLKRESNTISLLERGLWLRQEQQDTQPGSYILHAERVSLPDWTLSNVMVLNFDTDHGFLSRFDSDRAVLEGGQWRLDNPVLLNAGQSGARQAAPLLLKTTLTKADLNNSFLSSNTVSFWSMPRFIRTLKETGFPVLPVQVQFGSLLALPFLGVALVMVGSALSIRPLRSGNVLRSVVIGILAGFFVFFMTNFLHALGVSGQIPVWLAVLSPPVLTAAAGGMMILSIEDQ